MFDFPASCFRAHVQLQWLALLLRVVETATGDTWRNLRDELDRMHLVTLTTPAATACGSPSITSSGLGSTPAP